MNGLVKDFSPCVVVVLETHAHQVGSDCQARDVQVLGQYGLDFRIEGPVLGLKGRARALPGIDADEVLGRR